MAAGTSFSILHAINFNKYWVHYTSRIAESDKPIKSVNLLNLFLNIFNYSGTKACKCLIFCNVLHQILFIPFSNGVKISQIFFFRLFIRKKILVMVRYVVVLIIHQEKYVQWRPCNERSEQLAAIVRPRLFLCTCQFAKSELMG